MPPRLLKDKLRIEIIGLSESELDSFAELWTIVKKLDRHELLYQKGKTENNIYFIESGTLKICYDLKEQEVILGLVTKTHLSLIYPRFLLDSLPIFISRQSNQAICMELTKRIFTRFLTPI